MASNSSFVQRSKTSSNPANRRSVVADLATMDAVRKADTANVFVFNNTPNLDKTNRLWNSNISFNVTIGPNTISVNIPRTHVPIDIGQQCAKEDLFGSPNFLRAVNMGLLRLITLQDAVKYFEENEDAAEEYDLVVSKMSQHPNTEEDLQAMVTMPEIEDELPDNVSPAVASIVERMNAKNSDITEQEAYSLFRNIENSLTKSDIEYALNAIQSDRIQAFLNKIKIGK